MSTKQVAATRYSQASGTRQFTVVNTSRSAKNPDGTPYQAPSAWGSMGGTRGSAKIVPVYRTFIGEFSPPTFIDAILAYRSDTDTYGAVNFLTTAALYNGFFVTGDETYENGDAIKLIEDFNQSIRWGNQFEEHGLLPLLRILTPEALYSGNTFLEMQTPDDLEQLNQIQIATIWRIVRNEDGSLKEIWQKVGGVPNQLDPETIIHIPFMTINREAFGSGVLESLIRPRLSATGEVIPPWYIIKASLEYDIYRIIHRRGVPRSLWSFPDAGDEEVQKYNKELANPAVDATLVTNSTAQIDSEKGGPAQGIQQLYIQLLKSYQSGLQTPINNLLNSSGYTEASARVAKELGGLKIQDIQFRIKYAIEEELWRRVLIQAGFDPLKAKISLHWGSKEQPSYVLGDVRDAFDRAIIHGVEYRRMLRNIGWPLDDDSIFNTPEGPQLPSITIGGRGFGVAVPPGQTQQPDQNLSMLNPLNPANQAKAQGQAVGQVQKVNPEFLTAAATTTTAQQPGSGSAAPGATPAPLPVKEESDYNEEYEIVTVVEEHHEVRDARYRRAHKFSILLENSMKDSYKDRAAKTKTSVKMIHDEVKGSDTVFETARRSI